MLTRRSFCCGLFAAFTTPAFAGQRKVKTSPAGIALIKKHEGLRLKAYKCPAGVWTIGYGHTSMAGAPRVGRGMRITEVDAENILIRDLLKFEQTVEGCVSHKPNQNQFDALVSFCFNVGETNFAKSSVLTHFNARKYQTVPRRLALWCKAKGRIMPGLVKRRRDEGKHFLA